MPLPGGYSTFQQRAQQWTPPGQGDVEKEYDSPQARAMAYMNDLIEKTGAEYILSPSAVAALRRRVLEPYLGQIAQAGAAGNTQPGNFGEYLKNWVMTAGQPAGGQVGAYGHPIDPANVQGVLNRFKAGKAAGAAGQTGGDVDVYDQFNANPNLLVSMISALLRGPFKETINARIAQALQQEPLAQATAGGADYDWLSYILGRSGLGRGNQIGTDRYGAGGLNY